MANSVIGSKFAPFCAAGLAPDARIVGSRVRRDAQNAQFLQSISGTRFCSAKFKYFGRKRLTLIGERHGGAKILECRGLLRFAPAATVTHCKMGRCAKRKPPRLRVAIEAVVGSSNVKCEIGGRKERASLSSPPAT
jgi:hypothetical protein